MTKTRPADMQCDVICADMRWAEAGLEALSETAAGALAVQLGLEGGDFEVVVMGCDDARIAALNAGFRDKDAATNVLSWPSAERGAEADGARPATPQGPDPELGDIAISWETCTREARDQGKRFEDHVVHLLVHGILHLLGYDHIREKDAALMESLEREILGNLGIADPYRG